MHRFLAVLSFATLLACTASAQSRVYLDNIWCFEQEDNGDLEDEITANIYVDGQLHTTRRFDIRRNGSFPLQMSFASNSRVEIELWERDRLTPPDKIGRATIDSTRATGRVTFVNIIDRGEFFGNVEGQYRLFYRVVPPPKPINELKFVKYFAQGYAEYVMKQRDQNTTVVSLHLHGRHNDRAGRSDYTTMLVLGDARGQVLWVSPRETMSVRGRWDAPDNNKHLRRTYEIPNDLARRIVQGEAVGTRGRTPFTSWKETLKVINDAALIYRALNGDQEAMAQCVGKFILPEIQNRTQTVSAW